MRRTELAHSQELGAKSWVLEGKPVKPGQTKCPRTEDEDDDEHEDDTLARLWAVKVGQTKCGMRNAELPPSRVGDRRSERGDQTWSNLIKPGQTKWAWLAAPRRAEQGAPACARSGYERSKVGGPREFSARRGKLRPRRAHSPVKVGQSGSPNALEPRMRMIRRPNRSESERLFARL
jgi:hypothetical protein